MTPYQFVYGKACTFRLSWNIKPIRRLKRWTSISMPRWWNEGSK
jgi:hypothetical protein